MSENKVRQPIQNLAEIAFSGREIHSDQRTVEHLARVISQKIRESEEAENNSGKPPQSFDQLRRPLVPQHFETGILGMSDEGFDKYVDAAQDFSKERKGKFNRVKDVVIALMIMGVEVGIAVIYVINSLK